MGGGGKWPELLSEIAPSLKRAAIMFNPETAPISAYMPAFETAARSLKVTPVIAPVHSDAEIDGAVPPPFHFFICPVQRQQSARLPR